MLEHSSGDRYRTKCQCIGLDGEKSKSAQGGEKSRQSQVVLKDGQGKEKRTASAALSKVS